jgi:hypothetical protein
MDDDTRGEPPLPVASKSDKSFLRAQVSLGEERVPVPEWQRVVLVREMTAEENREYQLSNLKFDARGNAVGMKKQDGELRLLQRTCWDDQGNRLFSEDDFGLLRKQKAAIINRLTRVAKRLSGLGDDDEAVEKEKND